MTRGLRALCALAAVLAALCLSLAQAAGPDDVSLPVPQRSQIDGSIWGPSDCGPAALAMALEAFGDKVSTVSLRQRANQLLGVSSPDTGTKVEHLAKIAQEHGFSVVGPIDGKGYRKWTVEQARAEVRGGHPVIAQVYFPLLPNQRQNPVVTDHFIVLVGTDGTDFIYNDPADTKAPGYRQRMTEAQLTKAWGWSGAPFAAFSVGPGATGKSLLPTPVPTPTPAAEPTVAATAEPQIKSTSTPTPMPTAEPKPIESPAEPLPRQATGGDEVVQPEASRVPTLPLPASPALVGFLILAVEIRSVWWRNPRGGSAPRPSRRTRHR